MTDNSPADNLRVGTQPHGTVYIRIGDIKTTSARVQLRPKPTGLKNLQSILKKIPKKAFHNSKDLEVVLSITIANLKQIIFFVTLIMLSIYFAEGFIDLFLLITLIFWFTYSFYLI